MWIVMKKWAVSDTRYIFKSPFGNLRADTCCLSNGKTIDDYYVYEFSDWVNIVALNEKKEVVLVNQYRHGVNKFILEIVAGGIENGESPDNAVARELQEETGYVCMSKPILLGKYYCNPAIQNNMIHTFFCDDIRKLHEQDLDDVEDIEVLTVPFNQIDSLIRDGSIKQLFTITAIELARKYMLEQALSK